MTKWLLGFLHVYIGWHHKPAIGYMINTVDPCVMCRWLRRNRADFR